MFVWIDTESPRGWSRCGAKSQRVVSSACNGPQPASFRDFQNVSELGRIAIGIGASACRKRRSALELDPMLALSGYGLVKKDGLYALKLSIVPK